MDSIGEGFNNINYKKLIQGIEKIDPEENTKQNNNNRRIFLVTLEEQRKFLNKQMEMEQKF